MDLTILVLVMSVLVTVIVITYDIKRISKIISINNENTLNPNRMPQLYSRFNYRDLRVKEAKVYTVSDKYVIVTIVLMKAGEEPLDEDLLIPEEPQVILPLVNT